jgi:hypothetical protein
MQEERKGGPPPDLMMKKGSDGLNWESMMIERLLNSYDLAGKYQNIGYPKFDGTSVNTWVTRNWAGSYP